MHYKYLLLAFMVCLSQTGIAQNIQLTANVKQALEQVKPGEIKADISYLADDKLKGRLPGTEGYQIAVDYVTDHLAKLGVNPAGENGTWLQTVRLRKAKAYHTTLALKGNDSQLVAIPGGGSYLVYPNPVSAQINLSAPMVFAGYGISEPALGYDDYGSIDVRGKVVVVMRGSPDRFSSSVSAHVGNSTTILKVAAQHGAVGVILAYADSAVKTLADISKGVYSVMDAQGRVVVSRSYYSSQVSFFATAKYDFLDALFKSAGKKVQTVAHQLKAGSPQSFSLNINVNLANASVYQDITSYNIVGKIEGSDPELKKQYVVHSAHLDHLGIGTPIEGDSIYNGAHDNASGVASLLGIAKIYHHIEMKPKRSVLVVMLTGEEMGDLGSGYFAKYPTVPVESMVADVNTDMPTIIAPLLSVTALGAEHSSLIKQVDQAAAYLGISVEPDPEPKQARFTRSDQYSFVLAGVPALHIKYGSKTADGKNNLNDIVAPWRARYYHKPQDDINGVFDFEAGKKYAQLNFLIGYLVAQDKSRPTWNPGDLFNPDQR